MADSYRGFSFKTCFNGKGFEINLNSWTSHHVETELDKERLVYSWHLYSAKSRLEYPLKGIQFWDEEKINLFREIFIRFLEYGYDVLKIAEMEREL